MKDGVVIGIVRYEDNDPTMLHVRGVRQTPHGPEKLKKKTCVRVNEDGFAVDLGDLVTLDGPYLDWYPPHSNVVVRMEVVGGLFQAPGG